MPKGTHALGVVSGLTRMILKAQANNLFSGLIDHIIDKAIAVLQYTVSSLNTRGLEILNCCYICMSLINIDRYTPSEVISKFLTSVRRL